MARKVPVGMKPWPFNKAPTAVYQNSANAETELKEAPQRKRCDHHSGNADGSEDWERPWYILGQSLYQLYGVHLHYGAVLKSVTSGMACNLRTELVDD